MEKLLALLLIAIIALVLFTSFFNLSITTKQPVTVGNFTETQKQLTNISFQGVSLRIPAVDQEGNGVITTLKVETKQGEGRVLVNINQLLFWIDTQNSIRVAQKVAQNLTGIDLSNIDLIYAIETNASIIEGPSAGAAIAVATIAAIQNKTINQSVMMTGTVNSDGSIGPVGEIVAKAKASKDVGAKLFLVPLGQAVQTRYKPVERCEKFWHVTYCSIEYKAEKIDVEKETGIQVEEVSNVAEALKYFLI
ncbi:MAG: hypothetical protein QMD12_02780 [Candidatus Aenigmarchaeota archaeon]|nr:hypothetical protein [Candidatus Aenigmarchaeota archaeon]